MNQKRAASIVDVARGAGVSPATVSRYLNKPDVVGDATKDRIESAIAELGYVRNRMAGSLHGQRTGAVGLVVPTIDNAIFSEMIEAFSTRLLDHDYTMLIASHGYSLDLEARLVRSLLERRVDAVGVIGFDHAEDAFAPLAERNIPFLSLWNYDADAACPCIGVDNEQAGWVVTRYLIDLGHHDIALLFGETANNDRARGRRDGALRALADAGLKADPSWNAECHYDVGDAKQIVQRWLSGERRPTAIVAGNDIIAQGAIYAAQSLGRRVPGDLSVVGIGDFRTSAHIEPALTTVRIPARRIGRAAADEIVRLINGEGAGAPILIEPDLKIRSSAARLPDPAK